MKTQKILLWTIVVIAVLIVAFYALNAYIYQEKQADTNTLTAQGEIVAIDLEQIAFDGPAVVTIETSSGDTETIVVPSMGLPLCTAFENIEDVFTMDVGQEVEVRGYEATQGGIIPCDAPDHYLRIVE